MILTLKEAKETKARKDHQCSFCYNKIVAKDVYLKSTHVYDGLVYDWKAHRYCDYIAKRLDMYEDLWNEGLDADTFQEYIHDEYMSILINKIPKELDEELKDLVSELRYVAFFNKLMFVLRHYKEIDKINKLT